MARVKMNFVGGWSEDDREKLEAALSAVEVATKVVGSPGLPGQLAADGTYLYLCTAPSTWIRFAAVSW